MKEYKYYEVKFSNRAEVLFSAGGKMYRSDDSDALTVTRETEDIASGFRTRLHIANKSGGEIYLEKAYPVCINSLSLGNVPSSEWNILNQGRHKNDLPSVCKAGVRDELFGDAVDGLNEEGRIIGHGKAGTVKLNGDQIGVITAKEHTLTVSFATADIQLTEIIIPVDESGNVGTILAGGEFNCCLADNAEIYTDWVTVDCQSDPFRAISDYADFVKADKKLQAGSRKPAVYSTWYYYGQEVTAEDVYTNIEKISEKSLPFTHFQIDDGWEADYGDWEHNEKFPMGMKKVADDIKQHGMVPGIWTCPLIVSRESSMCKEHADWLLRTHDGKLCDFIVCNVKYCILDCTNPGVIDWIENLYKKLRSWGYGYHKLDFTRAFPMQKNAVFKNRYITPVQAYVNAMKAVRRGIGDDSYLLICGGLYQPLAGIADAQRTGSDVMSMWRQEGGSPKIPFTVKQNVLRYFMNEWWHNDPDSLMVRRDEEGYIIKHLSLGLLNDDEAKTFTANQYFGGGLVGSTEALDKISDDRLYLLKHVMPILPVKVKPVNLFSHERFPSVIDVYVQKGWHTVCFVNWSDEPQNLEVRIDENYAESGKNYYVAAFFGKHVVSNAKLGDKINLGTLNPHSTEIVKIAPADVPQVIKSDCHFSMGGEVDLALSGSKLLFRTNNPYPLEMHYTIAAPGGKTAEITVPPNRTVSLEVTPK